MKYTMVLRVVALAVLTSLLPRPAQADPSDGRRVPKEREIVIRRAGPQHLDVDLDLLAGAQASLADVRIFDEQSQEVPYLLMPPPSGEPSWQRAEWVHPILKTEKESGFEADLGKIVAVDRFRLVGLPGPVLKRLRLEGSGDRTRYSLLASDETVFDLPENGLRRMEFGTPPGSYRYLRVTWDDRETRPVGLPGEVMVRLEGSGAASRPTLTEVSFDPRPGRPGISQWRIRLPGARLPITAIELSTTQQRLMRRARVSESRLGEDAMRAVLLGAAVLRRTERAGLVAADLRVPIEHPETSELVLSVDNGNNAPLTLDAVRVELAPQPWIYFEARRTGTFTMQFGDTDARAPEYDLEAERDDATSRPLELATFAGPPRPRGGVEIPKASATPHEALLHGSELEPTQFRFSRSVSSVGQGMTSLRLDAAVLAHSSLSDVRILDGRNRQVPYLLEYESEPLVVELRLAPLSNAEKAKWFEPRQSVYEAVLPFSTLPEGTLVLTTAQRVFRRSVELRVEATVPPGRPASTRVITAGTWSHSSAESDPPPLELGVPAGTEARLLLVVEDGDNVPLPLATCRLQLPARTLRFFRTKGDSLTLYYGSAGLAAPDYDLALLAQELSAVPALEGSLEPERALTPAASPTKHPSGWFWGVLVVTVLGLTALIVRLVKGGSHTPPDPPRGEPTTAARD